MTEAPDAKPEDSQREQRANAMPCFRGSEMKECASREPLVPKLESGLSAIEIAQNLRDQLYADLDQIRSKRQRWSAGAIAIRTLALALSASATILLGLADLDGMAAVGFAFSALVTTVTALESFFNFRSRWVSADEALARWHRAEESLASYVRMHESDELDVATIMSIDEERRDEWLRFSNDWLAHRRQAVRADQLM